MNLTGRNATAAILFLIFVFSAFTLFYHLGDRPLWGDEAETALLALNTIHYGYPKATDGRNYITLLGPGIDTNKDHVWTWSPWLKEYLAAGSFLIFGKSTLSARLPFALIAFFSIMLFAYTAKQLFHNNELTVIATLLLATNIPFILHARQCRYYALVFFSQILLIYAYHLLLRDKSRHGAIGICAALTIQFYSNYILVLPNLCALAASVLLIRKRYHGLLKPIALSFSFFCMLALPWLLYARPWKQLGAIGSTDFIKNIAQYFSLTDLYIFPFALLLPAGYFLLKNRKSLSKFSINVEADTVLFLFLIVPFTLVIISASPGPFLRYLLPVIPGCILLLSLMLVKTFSSRMVRILLVFLISISTAIPRLSFSFSPGKIFELPFIHCIGSISSKYENRLTDVVGFFKNNATSEQSILVADPEFPLIFYTNMRVINFFFNRYSGSSKLPDWIMTDNASGVFPVPLEPPPHLLAYYEPVTLRVHDTRRGDCRPDPRFFVPYTLKDTTTLILYRKK